jgi:hypothetical protein
MIGTLLMLFFGLLGGDDAWDWVPAHGDVRAAGITAVSPIQMRG